MRSLLAIIGLFLCIQLQAQQTAPPPQEPPFKRFPTIPPYELLGIDSVVHTKAELSKKPLLLMYFSPSCDHCIQQIGAMTSYWKELADYQIVLATYEPMEDLKAFITRFFLDKQPNLVSGRDTKFMLPVFFAMKSLPYMAIYDKKGALITTFEGTTKMEKVLEALAK